MNLTRPALVLATALIAPIAIAHGGSEHDAATPQASGSAAAAHAGSAGVTPFGRPGDPAKVTRTVNIEMSDAMRFTPATLEVRRGETIRFVVRNEGAVLHEMVLGTGKDLGKHSREMRESPQMAHAEPYMVHVEPGATGEMIWKFDRPGRFDYACLIPGHYEAGMKGQVVVR